MNILLALIALSFLIVIHELGHFTVAKLSGIKVHEFALFMGPKLFSIKIGETAYSLRLIPLGGYVKMEGEEQASEDERAFNKKPVWVRAAVIAAGPIANLVIAAVIASIIISYTGFSTTKIAVLPKDSPALKSGLQVGDQLLSYDHKKVYHPMDVFLFLYGEKGKPVDVEVLRNGNVEKLKLTPQVYPSQTRYILGFTPKQNEGADSNVVARVSKDSPAANAGIVENDRIVKLDDQEVSSRQEINDYLNVSKDKAVRVTVLRYGSDYRTFSIRPMMVKEQEAYNLGIGFEDRKGGFFENIKYAFVYSYAMARNIYYSLFWLVTGVIPFNQVSGPVGIVNMVGTAVEQGTNAMESVLNLLNLTALISINLGLFNLIPFPALDGSKLLLLLVEGIRRKPIPPEKEAFISMVGFVMLIMLMIFATSNDIIRMING